MSLRYEALTEPGPGEVLLGWLDVEGSGTLELLEKRVTWFGSGRPGDLSSSPRKSAFFGWAREMSALAYLDVNFATKRWMAADPALISLPGCDGMLMLAGVRSAFLVERLERIGFDGYPIRHTPDLGIAIPVPGTLMIQAERQALIGDLYEELRSAEPRLVNAGCAASRVAFGARPISQYLTVGAAPTNAAESPLEKLVAVKVLTDTSGYPDPWVPVGPKSPTTGAYRWRRPGQLLHALFDGKQWLYGDRSDVIHAAFALHQQTALSLQPHRDGDLKRGALHVHRYVDLPMLHKRAATLCTGFPARTDGAMKVYEGVPRLIAEVIAKSLGQKLRIR